jgi:NAD+ synthase (glutamine-hydrolysing)
MPKPMSNRRLAALATCNLGQWSMDFDGNLKRIKRSIEVAKQQGARYRVGPELEIPGYGCEDHFHEQDTIDHSWECLADLVTHGYSDEIVIDVGMPVIHKGVRYNCRVFVLNRRILLIRPKLNLANDGNYRETRYFTTWKHRRKLEEHTLPRIVQTCLNDQRTCPFGDGVLCFPDAILASETCEELFTPASPHIDLALAGVEIITNGSGSHHQLRKLYQRMDLMLGATAKAGGVYLYANQRGCDGGRLYYDGCASIIMNGKLLSQGKQFSIAEVEVLTATVDLDAVVSYRGAVASLQEQASAALPFPLVRVDDFTLCAPSDKLTGPTRPIEPEYLMSEEEISLGPALWLWDYLRRSGASGFLLPLSGGADSSAVAAIVGSMCQLVFETIKYDGNDGCLVDARELALLDVTRILGARLNNEGQGEPEAPKVENIGNAADLANQILTTVYMGTENSSQETRRRAAALAQEIGSYHMDARLDVVITAIVRVFASLTGRIPRFKAHGGSTVENLALQNIQARLRMVFAFVLAQLMPWARRDSPSSGFLLVLGSSNVDETLRGYLTKYDCSAADINPIGGISKTDLRAFLTWGSRRLGYPTLAAVASAVPTAELEPLGAEGQIAQTDEADMGMSYEELSMFGRLRKVFRHGPVSMFRYLLDVWKDGFSPDLIAVKVKHFFTSYAINRHKTTVLPPSYHAENYSPDDNRFDHRQFLYNTRWPWQYKKIDDMVNSMQEDRSPMSPSFL